MQERPGQRPTSVNRAVVRPPTSPAGPARTSTAMPAAMTVERGGVATTMPLMAGPRYVVGRHDAADVVFEDDGVSRLHGVLCAVDGRFVFEDYGSQNGTVVLRADGSEQTLTAREPVVVGVGDVIEVGGADSRLCLLEHMPEADRRLRDEGTEVSDAARAFAEHLRLAGRTRVPVFLLGPSGAGKTHSARRLHELSRLPGPFVPINCARLPTEPAALHSELLGHVRGAFTGADAVRTGKLVQADGGTLFLDEVESLPAVAQGFLLDVLEGSGDLAPLGSTSMRLKPLAFRLVSASKRPLSSSGLRADLCERLAEGHLWRVPGLEDRVDDIPGLLLRFCREQSGLLGVDVVMTPSAIRYAQRATWPGQVRQLRATVVALAQLGLARALDASDVQTGRVIVDERDLIGQLRERGEAFGAVVDELPHKGDARRLTRAQVEATLSLYDGNQVKAAAALGIARNTLRKRLADET
jgi:DNA-binding NtrC family response regulator